MQVINRIMAPIIGCRNRYLITKNRHNEVVILIIIAVCHLKYCLYSTKIPVNVVFQ